MGINRRQYLHATTGILLVVLVGCGGADGAVDHEYSYRLLQPTRSETVPPEVASKVPSKAKWGTGTAVPELPSELESTLPLTVTAVVRVASENGEKHFVREVTRTADRVHVSYVHQGQEWLFVRNPLDHRRVNGQLVDHRERAVLNYYESDLSDSGVARGWVEVMTLGLPYDVVASMHATGETETRFGVPFERYVWTESRPEVTSVPDEVWWNERMFLPLKIVRKLEYGLWVQELVRVDKTVVAERLSKPMKRFPGYENLDVVDIGDWDDENRFASGGDAHAHHH